MEAYVSNDWSDANGTHLQGYVSTTYAELTALLGEGMGSGDKTTQEWVIKFSDGLVATIYDWKEYSTPLGEYDWHIGGTDRKVVQRVKDVMAGYIPLYTTGNIVGHA